MNDGIEKGIIALVNARKHFKASKSETTAIVEKEFAIPQEKAEGDVKKYWGD